MLAFSIDYYGMIFRATQSVELFCAYDLRFGLDSLASIIESKSGRSPYVPDTLYLFCGRKTDRIKGLAWEKDAFLLLLE